MNDTTPSPSASERAERTTQLILGRERDNRHPAANDAEFEYCSHIITVAITAAEQAARPQWLPIETAPLGQEILGGWYYNNSWWRFGCCENDGYGWFGTHGGRPTHWLPLPEPPSKETE